MRHDYLGGWLMGLERAPYYNPYEDTLKTGKAEAGYTRSQLLLLLWRIQFPENITNKYVYFVSGGVCRTLQTLSHRMIHNLRQRNLPPSWYSESNFIVRDDGV